MKCHPLFLSFVAMVGFFVGLYAGGQQTNLRETSLVDPRNPNKIVMQSGKSYFVFPGGYETVPLSELKARQ